MLAGRSPPCWCRKPLARARASRGCGQHALDGGRRRCRGLCHHAGSTSEVVGERDREPVIDIKMMIPDAKKEKPRARRGEVAIVGG